jgi:hypothetical protein
LAISDGFVVTPSTIPMLWASLISSTLAVSIKNFMIGSLPAYHFLDVSLLRRTALRQAEGETIFLIPDVRVRVL